MTVRAYKYLIEAAERRAGISRGRWPMRVVVTGASSSPGFKAVVEFAARGFEVVGTYNRNVPPGVDGAEFVRLDLADLGALSEFVRRVRPDVVVHMVAVGDVDLCEVERGVAWRVNVEATRALVAAARRVGARFVYLSTDYVFDGERGLYGEDDVPSPVNFYGLTKLVAEEAVRSLGEGFLIVRTSSIYGFGPGRPNFGRVLVERLSRGEEVYALVDQYLSPTLNTLLARAIVELVDKGLWGGVFHVAGPRLSRFEFAVKLARRFGFDAGRIRPAYMRDMRWVARRPRDSSLDVSRARSVLSTRFYDLDYSLDLLYSEYVSTQR